MSVKAHSFAYKLLCKMSLTYSQRIETRKKEEKRRLFTANTRAHIMSDDDCPPGAVRTEREEKINRMEMCRIRVVDTYYCIMWHYCGRKVCVGRFFFVF